MFSWTIQIIVLNVSSLLNRFCFSIFRINNREKLPSDTTSYVCLVLSVFSGYLTPTKTCVFPFPRTATTDLKKHSVRQTTACHPVIHNSFPSVLFLHRKIHPYLLLLSSSRVTTGSSHPLPTKSQDLGRIFRLSHPSTPPGETLQSPYDCDTLVHPSYDC